MIKRIIRFFVITIILFAITFSIHQFSLSQTGLVTILPILGMYLYHSISGAIVYIAIEMVFSKLPDQAGYAFLASVFIKIGFFTLIFSPYIFTETPLVMLERLSIVVPFFAFLLLESFFSFKLLNKAEIDPTKVFKNLDEKV